MKTTLFSRTNLTAAFVAAALFLGGCKDQFEENLTAVNVQDSKGSETAQSIMVEFDGATGTYANEGDVTWNFSSTSALRTYFQNNFNISPSSSNNGVWNAGVNAYACDLFSGAAIVAKTYRQGQNTYTLTPKTTFTQTNWDEKQFWTSVGTVVDQATVSVSDLFIASLSALNNKKQGNKYSFSLLDRVNELTITVLNAENNIVSSKTLADFIPGTDYSYLTGSVLNDKFYSSTSTYGKNTTILLDNQSMGSIIRSSGFGGQVVTDENTQALSFVEDISFVLPAGSYTFKISGTIKGNSVDGTVDQGFSVSQPTAVNTLGCE